MDEKKTVSDFPLANLDEEQLSKISKQLEYTREWGAKLVVPIPELTVF